MGVSNQNLHKSDYIHFDALRKVFLFTITNKIVNFFKQNENNKVSLKQIKALCEAVKKRCNKGSYFYGPKQEGQTSIKSVKAMANYIARYASHPALSERRLSRYDKIERKIYWYYDPHEDDTATNEEDKLGRQEITDDVDEFIKKLIIHIPEKGFQQIRYYGFYRKKHENHDKMIMMINPAQHTVRKQILGHRLSILRYFYRDAYSCPKCNTVMKYACEIIRGG